MAPGAVIDVPGVTARAIARMLVLLEERRAKFAVEMAANGYELEHVTSEARLGDSDPPTYQSTFEALDECIARLQEAFPDAWPAALELAET